MRYLSVLCNSVDAERSVSQYNLVNAPQRQSFSDDSLALHVMMPKARHLASYFCTEDYGLNSYCTVAVLCV